jgi:hypothetical protein
MSLTQVPEFKRKLDEDLDVQLVTTQALTLLDPGSEGQVLVSRHGGAGEWQDPAGFLPCDESVQKGMPADFCADGVLRFGQSEGDFEFASQLNTAASLVKPPEVFALGPSRIIVFTHTGGALLTYTISIFDVAEISMTLVNTLQVSVAAPLGASFEVVRFNGTTDPTFLVAMHTGTATLTNISGFVVTVMGDMMYNSAPINFNTAAANAGSRTFMRAFPTQSSRALVIFSNLAAVDNQISCVHLEVSGSTLSPVLSVLGPLYVSGTSMMPLNTSNVAGVVVNPLSVLTHLFNPAFVLRVLPNRVDIATIFYLNGWSIRVLSATISLATGAATALAFAGTPFSLSTASATQIGAAFPELTHMYYATPALAPVVVDTSSGTATAVMVQLDAGEILVWRRFNLSFDGISFTATPVLGASNQGWMPYMGGGSLTQPVLVRAIATPQVWAWAGNGSLARIPGGTFHEQVWTVPIYQQSLRLRSGILWLAAGSGGPLVVETSNIAPWKAVGALPNYRVRAFRGGRLGRRRAALVRSLIPGRALLRPDRLSPDE